MHGKIDYKFLDCAKRMPALYNKLPNEQYDIKKSEVVAWLVNQPEIQSKVFDMAKAQHVIEYDKDSKKWKGIDFVEDDLEDDKGFDIYSELEKTYNTEIDFRGIDSIGVAIYSKCLEKDLSITKFFFLLNEYGVYINDLRSESLNSVVVYGASIVLGGELYQQIQNDRVLVHFLRQLISRIDSMSVTINAEVNENAPIYISLRLKRNDEETIIIECEADTGIDEDTVEVFSFSVVVERLKEQVVDEIFDASHESCSLLDQLCKGVLDYKYIEDDIIRICRLGIKDYLLKLTDDNTIDWEWDGQSYIASMGEENYSCTYNPEEDNCELEIDIADRLVFTGNYKKNEVDKLSRAINKSTTIDSVENKEFIGIEDFLVRASNYTCIYRFHNLQRIHAIVNVLKDGKIKEIRTEAAYCPECDRYYILERDYLLLKRSGTICCKIVEFQELLHNKQSFSDWQEKSILRSYGYTVSKTENLTKQERHQILDFVLENGIMSSNQIISHLVWQIETRKNMRNMQDAIFKWEDDIRYVRQYQFLNKSVRVRQIFVRHKEIIEE